MTRHLCVLLSAVAACFLALPVSNGQSAVLDLPLQSQKAVVTERIGITDITVTYHRPLVNGRKIWGGVVPYGEVWRAGANQNTTIAFSDPVSVEGSALDRGTYGLHMIPGETSWTVIFSKVSTAWGSFTYNQAEDALRVNVKPQPAESHEALTYDFDDVKANSALLTLRWEKVAVPFKIDVNVNQIVDDSLHRQLRGLAQYTWEGWDDAANYLLASKYNLDEALKFSDKSIENEDRFDNELTKSKVLEAMGRKEDARATQAKALEKANPLQIHMFARQLQQDGKQDQAFEIFRTNAKKNPNEWFVHSGLARIYSSQGDFDNAAKEMKTALAGAPENQKTYVAGLVKRLESKQDINK
jgi:hypothetical protein